MTGPSVVRTVRGQHGILQVTIPNGQSITPALDLRTLRIARISFPAGWTTADLTFQASPDGTTYNNLYDAAGNEYTVKAAAARDVLVSQLDFSTLRYLKIRSGTSGAAVNQGADRILTLWLLP